jgi:SprT-like family
MGQFPEMRSKSESTRSVWKTQKQLEKVKGMHHVYGFAGFTKGWKQRIVLNIDAHVRESQQLLNTFVHESIHLLMPFGDSLHRKSSYGETTNTQHGEEFGAEARRINALLGYKLMSDEDCSHGIGGRKWAYDNVTKKCDECDYVDECGIDTAVYCQFEGTKRQLRKHKKEHTTRHEAWSKKFGGEWSDEELDFVGGLNDEYERFKDKVRNANPHWVRDEEVVRLWRAHRTA